MDPNASAVSGGGSMASVVLRSGAVEARPIASTIETLVQAMAQPTNPGPYGLVIPARLGDLPSPAAAWRSYLQALDRVEATFGKSRAASADWLAKLSHPGGLKAFTVVATSHDPTAQQRLTDFMRGLMGQYRSAEDVILLLSAEAASSLPTDAAVAQADTLPMLLLHVRSDRQSRSFPVNDPAARSALVDEGIHENTYEWRKAFIRDVPTWTAQEISEQGGRTAKNAYALATRWAAEGKIFAVKWGGKLRYPSFQFRHGETRPVVARVLRALGENIDGWDQAFFFATPNAYLNGHRPIDRLDDRTTDDVLVQLAERHANPADVF